MNILSREFHRVVCVGFVIAVFALACQAQAPSKNDPIPSESTLETWLRSGDPRLEAWGAHDALVTRDADLISYLLSLAGLWRPPLQDTSDTLHHPPARQDQRDVDERAAMAVVLDTLIQLNVAVPADSLRTLATDFPIEVAILLPRLSAEDSTPLSLRFLPFPRGAPPL